MTSVILRPRANGTYHQLQEYPAGSTHYVDESDQLDTTYIGTANPSPSLGYETFPCATFILPSGNKIDKVRQWIRHEEQISGSYHAKSHTVAYIAGILYEGSDVWNGAWTNDYTEYVNNPAGGAWTEAAINNAEFGHKCTFALAKPGNMWLDAFVAEVWIEVFYSPLVQPQITTLDGITLTVTKWDEGLDLVRFEWDTWTGGTSKRKVKTYNIVRTYIINCIEQDVTWTNNIANHFEATALSGATVIFYSNTTLRPVNNVSVYVKKVNCTLENLGTQNVRKITLTLQEA
jgi:hypothetical protein